MHVLSAGDGYTYYTSEVATGDIKRDRDRELGDYYTVEGNPPGRWKGRGAELLGVSGTVTEEQMKALFGEGLHPDADRIIADAIASGRTAKQAQQDAKLGRSYYAYRAGENTLQGRVQAGYDTFERLHGHEPNAEERRLIRTREGAQAFRDVKGREPADKEELGKFITAATRPDQQAVAGFDLVCSPAKSVSVLWALGDESTRKAIEQAQERAVDDTIRYLEQEAIATRAGTNGVAQIEVRGGIAVTAFRHYDSRTGDPQLHDHLVVANKAQGSDGKWRTIDSKLLHRQGVAASEFYNAAVMSHVSTALGVTTEARTPSPGKRPVMEIAGVDAALIDRYSSRSAAIRHATVRLTDEYQREHGRAPDAKTQIKIAQQATLESRPQKDTVRSPEQIHDALIAEHGQAFADQQLTTARSIAATRVPVVELDVDEQARLVLRTVEEHHAVWGAHVVEAEARRQIAAQITDQAIAEPLVQRITQTALTSSLTLTLPSPHGGFAPLNRSDGSSIYDHKGRTLYSSSGILNAEDRLLTAGRTRTVAPVDRDTFERVAAAHDGPLDAGQRELARQFVTSDLQLLIGIGPAGAGKTTALKLASDALDAGGRRMIGLAPSAPAAAVLGDAVGIDATTIHGFLQAHLGDQIPEQYRVRPGDVIVVDEAGMAGTKRLDQARAIAAEYGAVIRPIGDDRQLSAVEAGGALRLLDRELGSVQLEQVHRFRDPEEAAASLRLRDPLRPGDPFDWYVQQGRIVGGDAERMMDEVFSRWQSDTDQGTPALMLARTTDKVTELNARAQAYKIAAGEVITSRTVPLRDGLSAHVGDTITTRRNESSLRIRNGRDRVKNGDQWIVQGIGDDGALSVTHRDHGAPITLPPAYVRDHVEIGYARTIGRSQGLTTINSYTLADASMSLQDAYVPLSRGKDGNFLFLELGDGDTVRDALDQIAGRYEGLLSAHETIRAEQDRVDDLVTLIDQYTDAAERGSELRYAHIAERALGADLAATLSTSDSWGACAAALRHAETYGHDPVATLRTAYQQRELGSADDVPAVLSWRIERALEAIDQVPVSVVDRPAVGGVPAWIADPRQQQSALLPAPWREHLQERHAYIGVRLQERGAALALDQPAWTQQLGEVPSDPQRMFAWHRLAAEVDVLRTRYRVDPTEPAAIPERLRGSQIADRLQERVTALHKAAALTTAPPAAEHTRSHYADRATERVAAHVAARTAPTQQSTASVAVRGIAAAPAVLDQTPTRTPAAAAVGTSEGRTMTDPLDDAFDHIGRTVGKAGRNLTDAARALQQRRAAQQRGAAQAERDREHAARQAARAAEREQTRTGRGAVPAHAGDRDAFSMPPERYTRTPDGAAPPAPTSEVEWQRAQQRSQQHPAADLQRQQREQQLQDRQYRDREQQRTRGLDRDGDTRDR